MVLRTAALRILFIVMLQIYLGSGEFSPSKNYHPLDAAAGSWVVLLHRYRTSDRVKCFLGELRC